MLYEDCRSSPHTRLLKEVSVVHRTPYGEKLDIGDCVFIGARRVGASARQAADGDGVC